jgi:hypothetical protein
MCDVCMGYMKCGDINVYGRVELCSRCLAAAHAKYPQGWRIVPGDTCKHGTYVGNPYGPDYMCGACEGGD